MFTSTNPTTMRNAPAANSIAGKKRLMRLSSGRTAPIASGGREERHGEPERVDDEQQRRLAVVLLRRNRENAG